MSVEENFKGMMSQELTNMPFEVVKLLSELDKNIALKTDIENPEALSILKALSVYLHTKGLKNSSTTLNTLIKYYIIYRVSHNRKGRFEMIEALRASKDYLESRLSKLMGNKET